MIKSLRQPDGLISVGVALAALWLYVATLAPTVLEADSGEFQFVARLPGIAHPTGYPLYVLLGWLWSHALPFGEVAWRLNLFSAVLAAATVGLLYPLAGHLLAQTLPETPRPARVIVAVGIALIFGVTRTFWSQAIIAEVYALHTLFVVVTLGLVLRLTKKQAEEGATSGTKWLALCLGLSLTHHRTMVLLFPALLLFVWVSHRGDRPDGGDTQDSPTRSTFWPLPVGDLLIHLALFLTPLLLYLYLPLIAPTTPYATLKLSDRQILTLYDNSWRGFWDHVLGTVFTGELQPAAAGWDRLVLVGRLLAQQVGWPGIILALIGLTTLWQQRQAELLLLTGLGSLTFVGFNLIYFIGDVFVLFIPVWLFVTLWVGVGLLAVGDRLARRLIRSKANRQDTLIFKGLGTPLEDRMYRLLLLIFVLVMVVVLVIFLTIRNATVGQQENTAARDRWSQILAEPLPVNAILVSNDRNEIMPLWYYQYVEQRRPDLLGLFPLIVTDPAYRNVGGVLDQALASGRPVYLIKEMAGLALKAKIEPEGSLYRVSAYTEPPTQTLDLPLPAATLPANSDGATGQESVMLVGYDLAADQLQPGQPITVTLHWQATQPLTIDYTSYVHLIDDQGQGVTQNDQRPGGHFYPSRFWRINEVLRDQHTLTLPADLPPGAYHLRVGMYYQPEPGRFIGMGAGEIIGSLTVF